MSRKEVKNSYIPAFRGAYAPLGSGRGLGGGCQGDEVRYGVKVKGYPDSLTLAQTEDLQHWPGFYQNVGFSDWTAAELV